MKECKVCKKTKDSKEFLNGKKGLTVKTCIECRRFLAIEKRKENPEIQRKKDRENYQKTKKHRVNYAREYRIKYPERTRETNLKVKYGINQEYYNNLLIQQNNKCAICERDMDSYGKIFCVDHNHTTGKVRGLLCDPCNYGLGFFEKHKEKYIKYLVKHPN